VASFDAAGVTMRACEPELMEQERAFLEALRIISAAETSSEGTLSLRDESSTVRLLLSPLDQATTNADAAVPLDLAGTTSNGFDCGDAGTIEFRFLGPDTIEVTTGIDRYVMQHQRAASGARYIGEGAEFWNKGDEALFTVGEQRFECKRVAD
jgi:membrane-bound inhibitor of C-type lysozyme